MPDRSLYVSMSGAKEILYAQGVKANNLANSQTTGFKSDFSVLYSMPVYGEVHPSRVYVGAANPGHDLSPGALISSGNDLDLAINGEAFFVVQAEDGAESYTRRGDLTIGKEGFLVNGSGARVLGTGGPIFVPDHQKISVAQDGTISVVARDSNQTLLTLDKLKLVNPDQKLLYKTQDGNFRQKNGAVPIEDSSSSIITGMKEASNVNAVGELVDIITLAREYELNVKMMQVAEESESATARIMQI
ncbi:MAG: flagellar basal body rod protein FlgF [Gammaproteobacteria bacterium]